MSREEDNVRNCYCAIKATPKMSCEEENIAMAFQIGLLFGKADKAIEESKEEQLKMNINKIHDAMKVLKDECKMNKSCQDCVFYEDKTENFHCYLAKEPASWEEDEILENNCTTAHCDHVDERHRSIIRCNNCDELFILVGLIDKDHVIGKFCPHCGKKIVNYKEESE